MKKLLDIVRMLLISPELVAGLAVVAINSMSASIGNIVLSLLSSDQKWALGLIGGVPMTLLVTCYKLGTDILSPQGKRKVLLEWPEYWRLKYRVVYSLVVCVMALIAGVVGFLFILNEKSEVAAMLIIGAWAVAATSTASIALAKWRIREILSE